MTILGAEKIAPGIFLILPKYSFFPEPKGGGDSKEASSLSVNSWVGAVGQGVNGERLRGEDRRIRLGDNMNRQPCFKIEIFKIYLL